MSEATVKKVSYSSIYKSKKDKEVKKEDKEEVKEEDKEEVKEESFNLSIQDVSTYYHIKIVKASIGQIILCMKYLGIKEPKNVYQKKFNNIFLKQRAQDFVVTYEELLKCEDKVEKEVKSFNLTGPLPQGLCVPQEISKHGSKFVNKAKIGDLIQALYQRTIFIAERGIPKFYEDRPEHKKYFLKMQAQMTEFIIEIENLEEDFRKAVTLCTKLQDVHDIKSSMYKKE